MKTFAFVTIAALALSACGTSASEESADDFASRIGSGTKQPAAQGAVAPAVATPLPGAAPGPMTPGTQTDPNTACSAHLVGNFIGKLADAATQTEVANAAESASEVRFVPFGGNEFINPDPTNPRLNMMLDSQNIIRDARCG